MGEVLPFPLVRRVGYVDRQARAMASMSSHAAEDRHEIRPSNFQMSLRTREEAAKTFAYLGDLAVYVGQKAPGTFNDFVQAMKMVGAAAHSAGISIRWLSGAYILLDKSGIRNAEAGTALRSLVKHLVQPPHSARKMYAQLNVDPSKFLISGKKVDAGQMVAAFQSEYGKDLSKAAPRIQKVLESSLSSKDKGNALFRIVQRLWGKKMRPVDARKVKKSIDDFIFSATEKIDPQAWLDELAKKGVTLGQFLRLIEPRQASRLINLMAKEHGADGAKKMLDTPLSQMEGFREGLADEAGKKMMQGYPAAVKKLQDAFQSFIETLDNAGAIDKFSEALKSLGELITRFSKGEASWKDWLLALGLALPVLPRIVTIIGALGRIAMVAVRGVAGLGRALWGIGAAAVRALDSGLGDALRGLAPLIGRGLLAAFAFFLTPAGWASLAVGVVGALTAVFWPQISEAFSSIKTKIAEIDWSGAGAALMDSLWNGIKSKASAITDWFKDLWAGVTAAMPWSDKSSSSSAPLIYKAPPGAGYSFGWGNGEQEAASAGQKTGAAYWEEMRSELQRVDDMVQSYARRWADQLSFTARPSIEPKFSTPPTSGKDKLGSLGDLKSRQHALYADYGFGVV